MSSPAPAFPMVIRDGVEGDYPFIFATWLNHFRESPVGKLPTKDVYFREQHRVIERLLARSKVLVAANPDADFHMFGWLVGEHSKIGAIVHYAFVKSPFRKAGIAKKLLQTLEEIEESEVAWFTHLPDQPARALRLKPSATYDPWLAFR